MLCNFNAINILDLSYCSAGELSDLDLTRFAMVENFTIGKYSEEFFPKSLMVPILIRNASMYDSDGNRRVFPNVRTFNASNMNLTTFTSGSLTSLCRTVPNLVYLDISHNDLKETYSVTLDEVRRVAGNSDGAVISCLQA